MDIMQKRHNLDVIPSDMSMLQQKVLSIVGHRMLCVEDKDAHSMNDSFKLGLRRCNRKVYVT